MFKVKYEIAARSALCSSQQKNIETGITVMDGPFSRLCTVLDQQTFIV
jgi:hypothetical protein